MRVQIATFQVVKVEGRLSLEELMWLGPRGSTRLP